MRSTGPPARSPSPVRSAPRTSRSGFRTPSTFAAPTDRARPRLHRPPAECDRLHGSLCGFCPAERPFCSTSARICRSTRADLAYPLQRALGDSDVSRRHRRTFLARSRDRPRNREHTRLQQGKGHRLLRAQRRGGDDGSLRPIATRARGRTRRQGDARPDAREHPGDPPDQGRRDRRLRDHRGDAPLLHPARPQSTDPGPAANRDLRSALHHQRREARGSRIRALRRCP